MRVMRAPVAHPRVHRLRDRQPYNLNPVLEREVVKNHDKPAAGHDMRAEQSTEQHRSTTQPQGPRTAVNTSL